MRIIPSGWPALAGVTTTYLQYLASIRHALVVHARLVHPERDAVQEDHHHAHPFEPREHSLRKVRSSATTVMTLLPFQSRGRFRQRRLIADVRAREKISSSGIARHVGCSRVFNFAFVLKRVLDRLRSGLAISVA